MNVALPCKRHQSPASYVSSLDFGVPPARAEEWTGTRIYEIFYFTIFTIYLSNNFVIWLYNLYIPIVYNIWRENREPDKNTYVQYGRVPMFERKSAGVRWRQWGQKSHIYMLFN